MGCPHKYDRLLAYKQTNIYNIEQVVEATTTATKQKCFDNELPICGKREELKGKAEACLLFFH